MSFGNFEFVLPCTFFFLLLLLCGQTRRAAGLVDVHVANLTIATLGWKGPTEKLKSTTPKVTSVVCKPLTAITDASQSASTCGGFLAASEGRSLFLHMYAETVSLADSLAVSEAFRGWAEGDATELLHDISVIVSSVEDPPVVQFSKPHGTYTMPCRGANSKEVLPLCASTSNCQTTLLVDGLDGDPGQFFCSRLPTPCERYILFNVTLEGQTLVTITNIANTLELALLFTDNVRQSLLHASRVYLLENGRTAQLYARDENKTYAKPIKAVPQCGAMTSLWLFSLIALFPILCFVFCYFWRRGRRNAKKEERQAIVDDEMRLQNTMGSQGTAGSQPGAQRFTMTGSDYPQECAEDYYYYYYPSREQQYEEYYEEACSGEDREMALEEYVEPDVPADMNEGEGIYVDEDGNEIPHAGNNHGAADGAADGAAPS